MLRRLFTVLSALSLTLCVATAVLWVRSVWGGGKEDRIRGRVGASRYTGYSRHGRLLVTGPPPPPGSADVRQSVEGLAGRLRNDQIGWKRWRLTPQQPGEFTYSEGYPSIEAFLERGTVSPRAGTVAATLEQQHPAADCRRALLAALEDPDRFVAAHVLLTPRASGQYRHYGPPYTFDPDLTSVHATFDGMSLALRQPSEADEGNGMERSEAVPLIAPDQLPALREQWHRRLGVPVLSAPHWVVASAAALPPLMWAATRVGPARARRFRRRSGRCMNCGYDLRATPRRCPECGAAPAAKEA